MKKNDEIIEEKREDLAIKTGYNFEENNEDEQNLEALSLISKIAHKNLKARLLGFQAILTNFQKGQKIEDDETRVHLCLNTDIMFSENSPESQKMVLAIYTIGFFENRMPNENFEFNKKSFWYNFIDKFLASNKSNIKELANAFFAKLIKTIDIDKFIDIGIEFLAKNNLRLNKAILDIFNNEFERLGNWANRLSTLAISVDKLLLNPHTELRANLKTFMKKLVGSGFEEIIPFLKNGKPQFLNEIAPENSAKFVDGTGKQILEKHSYKVKNKSQQIDLYKKAEPVSIISKFTDVWIENVKSLKKWNEKQEAIEGFLKATNVPKLQHNDNYTGIIALAKILLENNNIHVQICAMKIFGAIARGLRLHARPYIKSNFNLLIAKLKDKKVIVLDALHRTIKDVFFCLTVAEIYEEVKIYNVERNKDIRLNVLLLTKNLFCFLIETKEMAKNIPVFLRFFKDTLNSYYDDQDIEVRNLNNELVLFIQEILEGDESNLDFFNEVIDLKRIKPRTKVRETRLLQAKPLTLFAEKSTKMEIEIPQGSHKKCVEEKKRSGVSETKASREIKAYVYKVSELSDDEVKKNITELLPLILVDQISNANWKLKEEGLKKLKGFLSNIDPLQVDIKFAKSVFGFLKREFKEYKDSNVLCIKLIFDCFAIILTRAESIDDLFYEFASLLTKKIAESKFKVQIYEIMALTLKKFSNSKILHIILLHQDTFINPKTLSDIFTLFSNFTDKNTIYFVQDLKSFVLLGLNNSNQTTRKSAISFFSKAAASLTEELALNIISSIENKNLSKSLERIILPLTLKSEKQPETVETNKDKKEQPHQNPESETQNDNLSNSTSIGTIIGGLIKQDWKFRKEAIESYLSYLEHSPHYFSVLNVHETFQNINLRLNDSQKLVALAAITKFKTILSMYFVQLKPYHKLIIENMLDYLVDRNAS